MNKKEFELNSAFIEACKKRQLDGVKYYLTSPELEEHADIHANNDYSFRKACENGHLEIVKFLLTSPELKEHADIHAKEDYGFRWACAFGHLDVADFLLHHEKFLSDRLTLCLDKIGEQRVFETLSTLSQEQQNYFYDMHKDFFDEHFDELFPLYLQNNTQLPDILCKEKQEEIEIFI